MLTMTLLLFALLLFGHFLADYPLQGDFVSKAKNSANPIQHVPWRHVMFAHVYIHGMFVGFFCWLVTGLWQFMFLEMLCHWLIDDQKCKGEITFARDQYLHILCKFVWAGCAVLLAAVL